MRTSLTNGFSMGHPDSGWLVVHHLDVTLARQRLTAPQCRLVTVARLKELNSIAPQEVHQAALLCDPTRPVARHAEEGHPLDAQRQITGASYFPTNKIPSS